MNNNLLPRKQYVLDVCVTFDNKDDIAAKDAVDAVQIIFSRSFAFFDWIIQFKGKIGKNQFKFFCHRLMFGWENTIDDLNVIKSRMSRELSLDFRFASDKLKINHKLEILGLVNIEEQGKQDVCQPHTVPEIQFLNLCTVYCEGGTSLVSLAHKTVLFSNDDEEVIMPGFSHVCLTEEDKEKVAKEWFDAHPSECDDECNDPDFPGWKAVFFYLDAHPEVIIPPKL